MDKTVAHPRIEHFLRGLLSTEPDELRRQVLERLLAPEQEKLPSRGEPRGFANELDLACLFTGA